MASANTIPNPSWTLGRQKQWAFAYSVARAWRLTSPRSVTVDSRPRCARCRRSAAISGPFPTMRISTVGDSSAQDRGRLDEIDQPLARIHPGHRQDGGAVRRAALRLGQTRSRHAATSIGSGTTARRAAGTPYSACTTSAQYRLVTITRSARCRLCRSQRAWTPSRVLTHPRSFRNSSAMIPLGAATNDGGARRRAGASEPTGSHPGPRRRRGSRAAERPGHGGVVQPPIERVKPRAPAQRVPDHVVAERRQATGETVEGDEGAAPLEGARRRRAEQVDAHLAPIALGMRSVVSPRADAGPSRYSRRVAPAIPHGRSWDESVAPPRDHGGGRPRTWWRWEELNLRHGAYETPALPLSYTAARPVGAGAGIVPQGLDHHQRDASLADRVCYTSPGFAASAIPAPQCQAGHRLGGTSHMPYRAQPWYDDPVLRRGPVDRRGRQGRGGPGGRGRGGGSRGRPRTTRRTTTRTTFDDDDFEDDDEDAEDEDLEDDDEDDEDDDDDDDDDDE